MVDQFTRCFELLVSNPQMGEQYHHPRGVMRHVSVGNYLVYYDLRDENVIVIRVLHGARQYEELL
jgi:plasmid stabilization system protein ParE